MKKFCQLIGEKYVQWKGNRLFLDGECARTTDSHPQWWVGVLAVDTLRAASVASPLVAFGLLLGGGHPVRIMNALLCLGNLICVNLAGVTPFLVQGIHPANWCENGLAVKATRVAIGLWVAVLGGMILMIFLLCRAGYARIK